MDEVSKTGAAPGRIFVSSPKILKRETFEATRDARDIVEQAREKAREILAEAERERDNVREHARQEGIAQGLAEWNAILAKTTQRAEALAKEWEDTMLRLSVRVAEKIIGEQLKVHPETIVTIIKEALSGARPGRHVAIQVNEAEAPQVRARIDRLKDLVSMNCEIEVVASQAVTPGGCVIESELGIIDARLETQLKCLEDVLVRGISAD